MTAMPQRRSAAQFLVRDTLTSSDDLFFFNDTATTEIYTLSLHDALPISVAFFVVSYFYAFGNPESIFFGQVVTAREANCTRSEEHTSELQSQSNIVCRLLLEKKFCYT